MEADSDRAVILIDVVDEDEKDWIRGARLPVSDGSVTSVVVSVTIDKNCKILDIFMYWCEVWMLSVDKDFESVDRMGKNRKARFCGNRSSVASHSPSVRSNCHVF